MNSDRSPTSDLAGQLAVARQEFLGFVRARIADPDLAEDVLQDALLRATESMETLQDQERLVPWFDRILRNAIVDAYRRRDVRQRRTLPLLDLDLSEELPEADDGILCTCFQALLPSLKAEYAEVIQLLDLDQLPTDVAARRLGVRPSNLKVRRHRARQALRRRLEETCRTCSEHGCLDCTCRPSRG